MWTIKSVTLFSFDNSVKGTVNGKCLPPMAGLSPVHLFFFETFFFETFFFETFFFETFFFETLFFVGAFSSEHLLQIVDFSSTKVSDVQPFSGFDISQTEHNFGIFLLEHFLQIVDFSSTYVLDVQPFSGFDISQTEHNFVIILFIEKRRHPFS